MLESEYKAREREQTVLRYNGGAPRLHDESNERSDNIDFYGFIYDGGVPDDVLDAQRKIRQQELKREKKWEKLMQENSKNSKKKSGGDVPDNNKIYGNSERHLNHQLISSKKNMNEKLIRRVYKGIPTKLRSLVWTDLLRYRGMTVNEAKYEEMVVQAHKHSPDIHQIDLDVNRTYRNTTFFNERYGPRQRQLFNVLAAYSMYNTDVGYCQGMSEIAAFLLMHLNEEAEVFWALHTLFTHQPWQMHGFFIKGFPKLTRYFEHHDYLIATHMPRLHKHLKKLDIHPSCYAFKWYMQCFIGLPYTLTLRLWDIFLVIGERLLIFMGFTIMKIIRGSLLRTDDQSDALIFMHEPLRDELGKIGDNRLIESLKDTVRELRYDWKPRLGSADLPPPVEHFGRPPPPDYLKIAQERQVEQQDVGATLRRSLRRSAQPLEPPPSPYDNAPNVHPSPNGDVPTSGPPKSLSLPDDVALAGQLGVVSGAAAGRRIRSQASSPLNSLPPPPPPPPPVPPHQIPLQECHPDVPVENNDGLLNGQQTPEQADPYSVPIGEQQQQENLHFAPELNPEIAPEVQQGLPVNPEYQVSPQGNHETVPPLYQDLSEPARDQDVPIVFKDSHLSYDAPQTDFIASEAVLQLPRSADFESEVASSHSDSLQNIRPVESTPPPVMRPPNYETAL